MNSVVSIKSPAEIAQARVAGQLAGSVLQMIAPHVKAGVTTEELDQRCHDYIVHDLKVIPANIGYQGFPKAVLTSVNHVVCHGIPSPDKVLKKGDIVNIDVAIIKDGWTVVTRDHSLSAQWEHMVAVTADGFEVLTTWPEGTGSYPAI